MRGAVKVALPRNWVDRVFACLEVCVCCVPFLNNLGVLHKRKRTKRQELFDRYDMYREEVPLRQQLIGEQYKGPLLAGSLQAHRKSHFNLKFVSQLVRKTTTGLNRTVSNLNALTAMRRSPERALHSGSSNHSMAGKTSSVEGKQGPSSPAKTPEAQFRLGGFGDAAINDDASTARRVGSDLDLGLGSIREDDDGGSAVGMGVSRPSRYGSGGSRAMLHDIDKNAVKKKPPPPSRDSTFDRNNSASKVALSKVVPVDGDGASRSTSFRMPRRTLTGPTSTGDSKRDDGSHVGGSNESVVSGGRLQTHDSTDVPEMLQARHRKAGSEPNRARKGPALERLEAVPSHLVRPHIVKRASSIETISIDDTSKHPQDVRLSPERHVTLDRESGNNGEREDRIPMTDKSRSSPAMTAHHAEDVATARAQVVTRTRSTDVFSV